MRQIHSLDVRCFLHYGLLALFLAFAAYVLCNRFLVTLYPTFFTLLRFALFGLVLFVAMVALHYQREKERVVKGTQLLTPRAFNRLIKGTGIGIPTLIPSVRSKLVCLRVRESDEKKHFLLCGDTGSGKSALQHYLLYQILNREKHSVVVYDPSLEFWKVHGCPEEGDILLYPFYDHCPYWGIAEEIRDGEYTN